MLNVERYLNFIVKNKLTQQQFLFLFLLKLKEVDQPKAVELIKLYKNAFPSEKDDRFLSKELMDDIVRRGYVIREVEGRTDFNNYTLGTKFANIFVNEYEAGNEFWDKYPPMISSAGQTFPMKLMDKNEFRKLYWKAINGNKQEHEEVIKDLDYAIEKSLIRGKIENFLKSEQWLEIRKIRLGVTIPIQGTLEERDF